MIRRSSDDVRRAGDAGDVAQDLRAVLERIVELRNRTMDAEELRDLIAEQVRLEVAQAKRDLQRVLLTPEQAADALNISVRRLRELTAAGQIACVKNGRMPRYRPEALQQWAKRNEQKGAASR